MALLFALLVSPSNSVWSADQNFDPRVKGPMAAGVRFLTENAGKERGGRKSLCALALFKAGEPATHPVITAVLADIESRLTDGKYHPPGEHEGVYDAGVELMLLVEVDPEKYYPIIQSAVDYLIETQRPGGGWSYPGDRTGDTSMSQYAMLGFWSAERAGVAVPLNVWNKAVKWHVTTQNRDGGFAYHPGTRDGPEAGASTHNLTNAGAGSLFIGRMFLYPDKGLYGSRQQQVETKPKKTFGVLEAVDDPAAASDIGQARAEVNDLIPLSAIDGSIRRALGWINNRFVLETPNLNKNYYYYTVERIGAFAETATFGGKDWFSECLRVMQSKQLADGSWELPVGKPGATALAILFMTRSTGKIIRETVGGGLLAGGRGLPTNLEGADLTGNGVKEKRKMEGPLDELLTELSTLNPDSLADAQAAIVEKVQVGNREELIGELKRIRTLIKHPNAEIRRTAVWALGRSGNLKDANLLIGTLNDDFNVDVLVEAYNSLSYLSRKIDGVGLSPSPFADLDEAPSQVQKDSAVATWRKEAVARWSEWYLRIRPYADRNDIFELGLGKKR